MARSPGIKERQPRPANPNAGRPKRKTFAELAAENPHGDSNLLLRGPNYLLAFAERQADADGVSTQEWIRDLLKRAEIESRIL